MVTKLTTLVADHDMFSRSSLSRILSKFGYEVFVASCADDASQILIAHAIDIVIIDLYFGASQPSGLDILKQAHQIRPGCEVIFVTSTPQLDTVIQALREGACDYLTKPVSDAAIAESMNRAQEKLLQRLQQEDALMTIEANLRKVLCRKQTTPLMSDSEAACSEQYRIGPVLLDMNRYTIEVEGRKIRATASEVQILGHLARNPQRVITSQELLRSIRGYTVEPQYAQETIRSHISNLRRKLSAASRQADIITTIRSVGYSLRTPAQRAA
jgi:DNA-binding response OmpR family regulator